MLTARRDAVVLSAKKLKRYLLCDDNKRLNILLTRETGKAISDKREASELQRGQLTMQVCAVSNLLDTQARSLMMVINDIRDLKPVEW